jgi:hypothetical protein
LGLRNFKRNFTKLIPAVPAHATKHAAAGAVPVPGDRVKNGLLVQQLKVSAQTDVFVHLEDVEDRSHVLGLGEGRRLSPRECTALKTL